MISRHEKSFRLGIPFLGVTSRCYALHHYAALIWMKGVIQGPLKGIAQQQIQLSRINIVDASMNVVC